MMEEARPTETFVNFYQSTQQKKPWRQPSSYSPPSEPQIVLNLFLQFLHYCWNVSVWNKFCRNSRDLFSNTSLLFHYVISKINEHTETNTVNECVITLHSILEKERQFSLSLYRINGGTNAVNRTKRISISVRSSCLFTKFSGAYQHWSRGGMSFPPCPPMIHIEG